MYTEKIVLSFRCLTDEVRFQMAYFSNQNDIHLED